MSPISQNGGGSSDPSLGPIYLALFLLAVYFFYRTIMEVVRYP